MLALETISKIVLLGLPLNERSLGGTYKPKENLRRKTLRVTGAPKV